jgi:hypothetical protein
MNAIASIEEAVVSNRYGQPTTMYRPVPIKGAAEQSPDAIAKAALVTPFSFYTSYDNTTKAVNDLIGPSVIVPVHLRMENPLRLPNAYEKFVGRSQLATMKSLSKGEEEGQFFIDKALDMANRIAAMPGVGDTDGAEPLRDKIAYLHYFRGSMHAYIYEKDIVEGEGQWQAKGYADLYGDGLFGEYGYCCIQEYIDHGVELDLNFTPRPIGDILREKPKRNDDDTSDNTPAPGA